jgi:hypothetical protein
LKATCARPRRFKRSTRRRRRRTEVPAGNST